MRKPSGSNRPVAKRCHSRLARLSSIPDTIQTSPFHVDTAARPSLKKSNAPVRMREPHGFSNGIVIVSTANGPSSAPRTPLVTILPPQRLLPAPSGIPVTLRLLVNVASASLTSCPSDETTNCKIIVLSCGGTLIKMRLPMLATVAPSLPCKPTITLRP